MTTKEIKESKLDYQTNNEGKLTPKDDIFDLFKNIYGDYLQIIPVTHCNIARFINASLENEEPNV